MHARQRHSSIVFFAVFAFLGGIGTPVYAEPLAIWLNPWDVSLNPIIVSGNASAMRAFGIDATTDGEIQDIGTSGEALSGTPAYGKAGALVHETNPTTGGGASTNLRFARDFSLSGSPDGWQVTLTSSLIGNLSIDNAGGGGLASVFAPVGLDSHSFVHEQQLAMGSLAIDTTRQLVLHLSDGEHRLVAGLGVSAILGASALGGGFANANFFGPGFHHFVTVTAVPIPEPGSLILVCSVFPLMRFLVKTRRQQR